MNRDSTSQSRSKRRSSPQGRMADTPHRATPPVRRNRSKTVPVSKSIYFGTLLFIQRSDPDSLTRHQHNWISNYAKKLDESQLLKAGRYSEMLMTQERSRYLFRNELLRIRRSIPWIEDLTLPESVRIGKGYTDKGALRPLHERGRQLSEIKFWDEDIPFMLPTFYTVKGEWITADEVKDLLGETVFGLVTMSLFQMVNPQSSVISQLQMFQSRRE